MRKILLVLLVTLTNLSAFAKTKEFKTVKNVINGDGYCSLVSGDMAVLGEKAPATLVFDLTNTHYAYLHRKPVSFEDKGLLKDHFLEGGESRLQEWEGIVAEVLEDSKKEILGKHGIKLYRDDDAPKYEMRLVFENLNPGSAGAIETPFVRGGAAFSGNLIVTEIATGKVLLNLRFDYIYGEHTWGFDYTIPRRMNATLVEVFFGRYLPTLYKKNK